MNDPHIVSQLLTYLSRLLRPYLTSAALDFVAFVTTFLWTFVTFLVPFLLDFAITCNLRGVGQGGDKM